MKSSHRLFLVGGLVIALFAATYFLGIVPANRRRDAVLADTDEKLTAMARLSETAAGAPDINAKIAGARLAIASFESNLPPARQMNNVVEAIWHLAQANSLQTRILKTSIGKRVGSYWAQEMDLSVSGLPAVLQPFLRQFEKMPSAPSIERISLTRIGGRDGDMQMDMTFCVLLQPQPPVAPGATASVSIDQR
jgi:Tfp pilus assembly protein PilO